MQRPVSLTHSGTCCSPPGRARNPRQSRCFSHVAGEEPCPFRAGKYRRPELLVEQPGSAFTVDTPGWRQSKRAKRTGTCVLKPVRGNSPLPFLPQFRDRRLDNRTRDRPHGKRMPSRLNGISLLCLKQVSL